MKSLGDVGLLHYFVVVDTFYFQHIIVLSRMDAITQVLSYFHIELTLYIWQQMQDHNSTIVHIKVP